MKLIACRSFFFAVLQFVVITSYYVSLRLAKKKQQRTLNTTQLRILGLTCFLAGSWLSLAVFPRQNGLLQNKNKSPQ